jgi:hypothetical protein
VYLLALVGFRLKNAIAGKFLKMVKSDVLVPFCENWRTVENRGEPWRTVENRGGSPWLIFLTIFIIFPLSQVFRDFAGLAGF